MKKPDTALNITKTLADIDCPDWICSKGVEDPGGNFVNIEGRQCLICHKFTPGNTTRHLKSCAWVRAKRFLSQRKKAGRK